MDYLKLKITYSAFLYQLEVMKVVFKMNLTNKREVMTSGYNLREQNPVVYI